jgi:Fic family protein
VDPRKFSKSSAGKCLNTLQGYCAFLPNPLPPSISYDGKLVHLLDQASRLLGELSGTGRLLRNPHLLISPYIRREAVSSSRIEGTQASLSDLFFFEAAESEDPEVPDVKEVRNYVRAMEHGISLQGKLPVSIRLVKEIHGVLMTGVRGEHAAPGELRKIQTWIGPKGCSLHEATYVPPPVPEMKQALQEWEKYYHSEPAEPPLIQCALMHYQFEAIHPFLDGNGRIGRLLITFLLCEKQCLSQPLLYLSAFFERNREEYYDTLLRVSQKGEWRGWIEFFLRGVAVQAKDALSDATRILILHDLYNAMLSGTKHLPQTAPRLVDEIFSRPVISISKISREWEVPFRAVQRGVDRLVQIGLLREVTDRKRNRLFVASDLLDALNRPTN